MATVTSNKMTSLVKKGKLSGLQVVRLIHQYYAEGMSGREPTGFSEEELHKLTNNLEPHEWKPVKHWVHDGIDLLYGFAMNVQSNAALAAAEIHFMNTFLSVVIVSDKAELLQSKISPKQVVITDATYKENAKAKKIAKNFSIWEIKNLYAKAYIHTALWYNEGLKVVGDYMGADWVSVPAKGMQSLDGAVDLINKSINDLEYIEEAEILEGAGFTSIDLDSLKPSDDTIKEWKTLIEEVEIRDFLLNVAETEEKEWKLIKENEIFCNKLQGDKVPVTGNEER